MKVVVIGGWAPSLLRFRRPLLQALVARGHKVHALAADGTTEVAEQLSAIGVTFEAVTLARTGLDPRTDLHTLRELVQKLRAQRPDVVITYTIKPVVYGSLASVLARVPRRAALITGLGYAFADEGASLRRRVVRRIAANLYRAALASCQTVFLQNPDDASDLRRFGALPHDREVHILRGSGVDLAEYPALPLPTHAVRFLFMGRLLRDKGIYDYVDAARRVRAVDPSISFGVLGGRDTNPESVSAEELAAWEREGVIEYLGTHDDVRPYLADCHVLVLPSYREGTPRSVLEAMSVGRAIITTDVPGCRETIVDGESGLLIPVRNPAALAHAALRMIRGPALLRAMATEARRRVELLYDAHVIAREMVAAMGI